MPQPITSQSDQYAIFDSPQPAKDHVSKAMPREALDFLRGPSIPAGTNNTREASVHEALEHQLSLKDSCHRCWNDSRETGQDYGNLLMANHGDELRQKWHQSIGQNPGQGTKERGNRGPGRYRDRAAAYDPAWGADAVPFGRSAEGHYSVNNWNRDFLHKQERFPDFEKDDLKQHTKKKALELLQKAREQGDSGYWPMTASVVPHTYVPGHRVGLPHRDYVIPGTVTHLTPEGIGVRWDDGQHSLEEPGEIYPL